MEDKISNISCEKTSGAANEADKHIRLFIAVPVCDHLKEGVRLLPRKELEGRWQHIDDLHITIRFLGDLPETRLEEITQALARVHRPAFNIEARNLGLFHKKRQTILYAAIQSTRKLEALCSVVTDVLEPLGFDFGMRPYVPHVTLARLKKPCGLEEYVKKQGPLLKAHWQETSFMLVRSAASPPDVLGRRYQTLRRYDLAG